LIGELGTNYEITPLERSRDLPKRCTEQAFASLIFESIVLQRNHFLSSHHTHYVDVRLLLFDYFPIIDYRIPDTAFQVMKRGTLLYQPMYDLRGIAKSPLYTVEMPSKKHHRGHAW
jgi:hypothetical protein